MAYGEIDGVEQQAGLVPGSDIYEYLFSPVGKELLLGRLATGCVEYEPAQPEEVEQFTEIVTDTGLIIAKRRFPRERFAGWDMDSYRSYGAWLLPLAYSRQPELSHHVVLTRSYQTGAGPSRDRIIEPKRFGNVANFVRQSGQNPNVRYGRFDNYDFADFVEHIKNVMEEEGTARITQPMLWQRIAEGRDEPSPALIRTKTGNLTAVLKAAGVKSKVSMDESEYERMGLAYMATTGELPTVSSQNERSKNGRAHHSSTIIGHYGTWSAYREQIESLFEQKMPDIVRELTLMSLGVTAEQSAAEQGLELREVRTRRNEAQAVFEARTRNEAVAKAIQYGHVPIILKEQRLNEELSDSQDSVLRLIALGWEPKAMAQRAGISPNSINTAYDEIRRKLDAVNIAHAIRRAFEFGIFTVGELILSPDELAEQRTEGMEILLDGEAHKIYQLGITNPREIEILKATVKRKNSYIRRRDFSRRNFYKDAPSKIALDHAYIRAVKSLAQKLNQLDEEPLLITQGQRGQRIHTFARPIEIRLAEKIFQIPAFNGEVKPIKKPRAKPKPAKNKLVTINRPAKVIVPIFEQSHRPSPDDYLPPEELMDLEQLPLTHRPPEEVLENTGIKTSLQGVINKDRLGDYRSKAVVAVRFGIFPPPSKTQLSIRRADSHISIDKLSDYVPAFQGLAIDSASQLLSLKPEAILRTELELIKKHSAEFPALLELRPVVESELIKTLRANG